MKEELIEFFKNNIKDKMEISKALSYDDPLESDIKIKVINSIKEDVLYLKELSNSMFPF